MSTANLAVFLIAVGTLIVCLCRLNSLLYWRHRYWVVAFHVGLAWGCIYAAYHAVLDHFGLFEVSILIATIAWLVGSWTTWKDGVPLYHSHKPKPYAEPERRLSERRRVER